MDLKELKERQSWTLQQKIDHSLGVIDQFVGRLGLDHVYVSFSGGKDSTVLLDLCRIIFPNIKAVFCNTGNEYPDIVRFVRGLRDNGANIDIIYPKLKPQEVFEKAGFPLVSKEQSSFVRELSATKSEKQKRRRLVCDNYGRKFGVLSEKWRYLLKEPYKVSDKCCHILKKKPFKDYEKLHNVSPVLGIMASESLLREKQYIRDGYCNIFKDGVKRTKSMPLSIWTEQDIWDYIKMRNLPIADIYNKGASRTGCMFCGYGCQFKDDNRLQMVYDLYPKWYDRFMSYTNNGVTYREALRKVLKVNSLKLPDEKETGLFDDFFKYK